MASCPLLGTWFPGWAAPSPGLSPLYLQELNRQSRSHFLSLDSANNLVTIPSGSQRLE